MLLSRLHVLDFDLMDAHFSLFRVLNIVYREGEKFKLVRENILNSIIGKKLDEQLKPQYAEILAILPGKAERDVCKTLQSFLRSSKEYLSLQSTVNLVQFVSSMGIFLKFLCAFFANLFPVDF